MLARINSGVLIKNCIVRFISHHQSGMLVYHYLNLALKPYSVHCYIVEGDTPSFLFALAFLDVSEILHFGILSAGNVKRGAAFDLDVW